MIDDNKIEEAANLHRFELIASMHGSTLGTPMQCSEEVVDAETELIENSFITGAKWAIKEFLKNLWHDANEEPKFGKGRLLVLINGSVSILNVGFVLDQLRNLHNIYIYMELKVGYTWMIYYQRKEMRNDVS